MSARVVPLEDTAEVKAALEALLGRVEAGEVAAVAVVVASPDGGLEPWWGASRRLGAHAGSVLRGAVAYLSAVMDAEALER